MHKVGEARGGRPRILISLWPGIGDIMFSTPAIRHVRQSFPDSYIAVASFRKGEGRDLLATNPYIDELFFPAHDIIFSASAVRESLAWTLSRHFDIGLELSFPVQTLFSLAGIREKYRYGRRDCWWLVPYRKKEGIELHAAEHFLAAAKKFCDHDGPEELAYDLFLTPQDRLRADALLGKMDGARFVVMHPGARCNKNKRWELDNFVALGRRLIDNYGVRILIIGGVEDIPLGKRISAALGPEALVLAGQATLRETAAVIERAELYVGNDSGPLHIAASTKVPIVAIFGSSNPDNFRPLSPNSIVVQPKDECAPCFHLTGYNWLFWGVRLRYYNKCRALEGLGVEPVYAACRELLEGRGAQDPC